MALTEYVVLASLLSGAVIISVNVFGSELSSIWTDWANYLDRIASPSEEVDVSETVSEETSKAGGCASERASSVAKERCGGQKGKSSQ